MAPRAPVAFEDFEDPLCEKDAVERTQMRAYEYFVDGSPLYRTADVMIKICDERKL